VPEDCDRKLEKQIGLKLLKQSAQVDTVEIDHIQKTEGR